MADIIQTSLRGSFCALATPFVDNDDAAIDFAAFGELIDHQLAEGTRGLIAAGSTGEAAVLDDDEFSQLVSHCVQRTARRVPVGAGTGQQSTTRTITMTRRALDAGADFALVATPAYVRPTQEGLYRHFRTTADSVAIPLMLYNVPSRTGCDLLPETVARLMDHDRIIGIKEARAEPERMDALLALQSSEFVVFSGDDGSCADAIAKGAAGVISVSANVAPRAMQHLVSTAASNLPLRAEVDARLQPLHAVMGLESNPIPVKWCLSRQGIGSARMRLPLLSLARSYHAEAIAVLESLSLTPARR